MSFGEEMSLLPPVLFALGYFFGGWAVIWHLVMTFERGDPKFAEAVGFYYGIWILFYLPVAIIGTISLARMPGLFRARMIISGVSLLAVLVAMFVSFYFDANWPVLLLEYLAFGIGFRLLAKTKTNTEQAGGGNALPRAPHP